MEFWGQKTFCLITGASRGIGREIAIQFSAKLSPGSLVVLMGRDAEALEQVKEQIGASISTIQLHTVTYDLARPNRAHLSAILLQALETHGGASPSDYEHALLINNAGAYSTQPVLSLEADFMMDSFSLEVISMVLLTSEFFGIFTPRPRPQQRSTINVTAFARGSERYMGLYLGEKAFRNILMRSLAAECGLQVVNFDPGLCLTDQYHGALVRISELTQDDPGYVRSLNEIVEDPQKSVGKLVRYLEEYKMVDGGGAVDFSAFD